jgi:hypothetical protein
MASSKGSPMEMAPARKKARLSKRDAFPKKNEFMVCTFFIY